MKTRITDIFNIEYPIFQGGMAWVAEHNLAAAVSEAGGLGIIGAGGAPAEFVREQIQQVIKNYVSEEGTLPSKCPHGRPVCITLDRKDIEKIIDIELKDLRSRVLGAGYRLTVTPAAKRLVADAGYDPKFGARPLKRAVQKYIEDPVSEFIIMQSMLPSSGGATLKVGLSPDRQSTEASLVMQC